MPGTVCSARRIRSMVFYRLINSR